MEVIGRELMLNCLSGKDLKKIRKTMKTLWLNFDNILHVCAIADLPGYCMIKITAQIGQNLGNQA